MISPRYPAQAPASAGVPLCLNCRDRGYYEDVDVAQVPFAVPCDSCLRGLEYAADEVAFQARLDYDATEVPE